MDPASPTRKISSTSSKSDSSDLSSPGCLSPGFARFGSLHPLGEKQPMEADGAGKSDSQIRSRRKRSAIKARHGDALRNLKEALQKYSTFRKELEKSYRNTIDNVNELYKVLGMGDKLTTWLRERMIEEMVSVEGFVNKDPIIIVSGQVNCGKSSLVNEILERTCVPVEKTPCTAMLTRLKYSKTDYYQVFNADGTPKTEKVDFNAKKLKKDVQLESRTRESEAVECTVEIGLDNPILEFGIQIYDTPGTNENEALDAVVQQSLDGVLQVLIYVIDGNRSLTKLDEDFIETITVKYPKMNIVYVCNKCEESKSAQQRDAFSEDEEEGQPAARFRSMSKGEEVYERLLGMKKVDSELNGSDHDDKYFKVSCKKIRKARLNDNMEDEFMLEFLQLINALIKNFDECVYESLNNALTSLYAFATRVFDYFLYVKFLNQPIWESLLKKLTDVRGKEERAYEELHEFIDEQCRQLNMSLKQSIKERQDTIVSTVNRRIFGTSLETLDAESSSEKQRARLATVLQSVIYEEIVNGSAFHEIRTFIQGKIVDRIHALLEECERLPGVGDLVPQLKSCFRFELLSSGGVDFCQDMCKKSLSLTLRAILDKILQHFNPALGLKRQEKLRQLLVRRFLKHIDEKALGSNVAQQLFEQLAQSHNRFQQIVETIEKAHSNRKFKQSGYKKFIPLFSKEICNLKVLIAEVEILRSNSYLPGLIEIKSGHRNEVYVFGVAPRQHVEKKLKVEAVGYEEGVQELAVLLNCGRMLQIQHDHLITSFDLQRDCDGCLRVTLPFCQSNLFYGLYHQMKQSLKVRMLMAKDIVGACVYLAERGFRANDLRPSNILLRQWQPKIDLTKSKSLDTPYPEPDDEPPFHFAPEAINNDDNHQTTNQPTCSTYDTYSCVILIWLLSIGKFIRPSFAQKKSIGDIQNTILSNTYRVQRELLEEIKRQLNSLQSGMEQIGLTSLVQRNIVLESSQRMTISELHEYLEDLYTRM
ncbi:uncharacterized protein LOC135482718 [Lineus longissimus]|uniref:uncharacterized protein LOC135482718 n=1 Tax=Lineus longissimus TaxID=88925 RepID=UPI00315D841F